MYDGPDSGRRDRRMDRPSNIIHHPSYIQLGGFRRVLLLVRDGLEPRDVLAERAQLVGFFHLAGLLAQLELEELLADLAELGVDLGGREIADFFRSHDGTFLREIRTRRRRAG